MNDLISRQAAIDALRDVLVPQEDIGFGDELTDGYNDGIDMAITTISGIPSTQPDSLVRPSARWISIGHKRERICSHCFRDEPYKFADHDADVYDFCPHCGADMRGEDHEKG